MSYKLIKASGSSGAANSFTTIACTSGTNPVADSATDTLTLTAGTGITITGDSATDTVTIASTVTGGVSAMAAVGAVANANGASISGTTLTLQPASQTLPGVMTAGAQVIGGDKTFKGYTLLHPIVGGLPPMVVANNTYDTMQWLTSALGGPIAAINNVGRMTATGFTTYGTATSQFTGIVTTDSGRVYKTRVVTAAGAVTVATSDHVVIVNKSSGEATTVNLPGSPTTGTEFTIKDGKGDAGSNTITVTPAAGNIDGAATYPINVNYQSRTFVYNGTQWNVIAGVL
jgi:hypothetical protein